MAWFRVGNLGSCLAHLQMAETGAAHQAGRSHFPFGYCLEARWGQLGTKQL